MPISTQCLEAFTNSCIAAGPDCLKTQQLIGISTAIETAAIGCSVTNVASLPSAIENEGRMIFVEDIGAYRYSNGVQWTNNYDSGVGILFSELYVMGHNAGGQLGTNDTICYSSPVKEITLSDWSYVSITGDNSRARSNGVKKDGTLWSWGCTLEGALGNNGLITPPYRETSPVQEASSSTNWCYSQTGRKSSFGIKTDGTLWGWGCANYGTLATGDRNCRCSPVQEISSSTNWVSVAGGGYGNNGLKSDGTLWGWGFNYGQTGDNTGNSRSSPTQEITSSTNWCYLSKRDNGSTMIAIKTDGTLWGSGNNGEGEIGDGTLVRKSSPVQEICGATDWCSAANAYGTTLALKTNGTMWGWGNASNGRIGRSSPRTTSPIQEFCSATNWAIASVSSNGNNAALKTDGTLWLFGPHFCGSSGNNILSVSYNSPVQENTSATDWCFISQGCNVAGRIKVVSKGFNEP